MINEHILKIVGSSSLEDELKLENDYSVSLKGNCYKVEESSNQDGTINRVYKIKLFTAEVTSDDGKKIIAKPKGKMSVAMRFEILDWGREHLPELEDEEIYQQAMVRLMERLPDLLGVLFKEKPL